MKLYENNGYLNFNTIYNLPEQIIMVMSGRGPGKTYGGLKYMIENNIKHVYVRRLQSQLEVCSTEWGNPYKKVAEDCDWNIKVKASKTKGSLFTIDDKLISIGLSLSTFGGVKGVDFSQFDAIIFDEFLRAPNERPIKEELYLFLNMVETVNRNRELENKKPVKVLMFGNLEYLGNEYIMEWGNAKHVLSMQKQRREVTRLPEKSRALIIPYKSPIATEKEKKGFLYKNSTAKFSQMALAAHVNVDLTNISSYPIKELKYLCSVGELAIYRHKSLNIISVTTKTRKENYFAPDKVGLVRFKTQFSFLKFLYIDNKVKFDCVEAEYIFCEYLNI